MSKTRPNIIYIHSHDTGRYISPYGHKVNTPNLQKFAEDGVVFRQCFCANPTCSPSRAALLTGEYAHSCGMLGLAHRGISINDYSKHLLHTLRDSGYKSYLIGIQHIIAGTRVDEIGYDDILTRDGFKSAVEMAPIACDLIKHHKEPFFLSFGCFETHRKFPEHSVDEDPRWTRGPEILPDTPEVRLDMARFNTMAKQYDDGVGMILDCLKETGEDKNTLVIITTDHGIAFPDMKCNLTDHGIGVLLMMRGPNGVSGGKVVDSMVSHVDIFPTICDYLDITPPERLQGLSQMPVIKEEKESVRDAIFAEVNIHAGYEPMRCVRTSRYKYIKRMIEHKEPVMSNCDNSLCKDVWAKAGWAEHELPREELYDLVFDPMERNNIADKPEMGGVIEEMRGRLQTWMEETDDPALKGLPAVPKTSVICETDSFSPEHNTNTADDPKFCERNKIPVQS